MKRAPVLVALAACTALGGLEGLAAAQEPPASPEKLTVGNWSLAPSIELRARGEYRRDPPDLGGVDAYGRASPRVRDAFVVMERTRIGLGAESGALRAQVTLQDARALGLRGRAEFAPYEAYGEVRTSEARPSFVRLGRQAVVFGEGRLVGAADFSPVGRSLDAARGRLVLGDVDLDAMAVLLEAPAPIGAAFGDKSGAARAGVQLYALGAAWSAAPAFKLEALSLLRVARGSGDDLDGSRFRVARLAGELLTLSVRASGDSAGWTYGVEGAYQLGHAASIGVGGSDVRAFAGAGHVARRFDEVMWSPTVRLSASYASGDDGGGGTYTQFDPLLPDPQRFHGPMDLFAWSNHLDAGARVHFSPRADDTLTFGVGYRYARLAEARGEWIGAYLSAVGRAGSSTDAELGHEAEARVAWRPFAPLELRASYAGMLLGDGARAVMASHARGTRAADGAVRASTSTHYAYLMATLAIP